MTESVFGSLFKSDWVRIDETKRLVKLGLLGCIETGEQKTLYIARDAGKEWVRVRREGKSSLPPWKRRGCHRSHALIDRLTRGGHIHHAEARGHLICQRVHALTTVSDLAKMAQHRRGRFIWYCGG
jgi:hypothetical protein